MFSETNLSAVAHAASCGGSNGCVLCVVHAYGTGRVRKMKGERERKDKGVSCTPDLTFANNKSVLVFIVIQKEKKREKEKGERIENLRHQL